MEIRRGSLLGLVEREDSDQQDEARCPECHFLLAAVTDARPDE